MSDESRRHILPMTTDDRHAFRLQGQDPAPPTPPGESIRIEAEIVTAKDPRALVNLVLFVARSCATSWRLDQITIDGREQLDEPVPAGDYVRDGGTPEPDFAGSGHLFEIRATNVSDAAAYFYASFVGDAIKTEDA